MKREALIDPSLEKTLLSLHAAMNVVRFGKPSSSCSPPRSQIA